MSKADDYRHIAKRCETVAAVLSDRSAIRPDSTGRLADRIDGGSSAPPNQATDDFKSGR
jgi:hypothetical protein